MLNGESIALQSVEIGAIIQAAIYDKLNVRETTTETPMGKVIATVVITNRLDEAKAEDGVIPIEQVRSVTR